MQLHSLTGCTIAFCGMDVSMPRAWGTHSAQRGSAPKQDCFSTKSTLAPALAALKAALQPAGPPPTTKTSTILLGFFILSTISQQYQLNPKA
jgi:hypothetical protein